MNSSQTLFITTWQKHSCGGCNMYYYDYKHLLEHLYWKHGTESEFCAACGLKKWKYSKHFCHVLPIDDVFVENFANVSDIDESSSSDDDSDNCGSLTATEHQVDVNENYSYGYHKGIQKSVDPNSSKYLDQSNVQHPLVESYLKYSADQAYVTHTEPLYCYCRKHVDNSQMIGCDEPTCTIQWYHFSCVGIDTPPDGDWLCSECRAKNPTRANKGRRMKF